MPVNLSIRKKKKDIVLMLHRSFKSFDDSLTVVRHERNALFNVFFTVSMIQCSINAVLHQYLAFVKKCQTFSKDIRSQASPKCQIFSDNLARKN